MERRIIGIHTSLIDPYRRDLSLAEDDMNNLVASSPSMLPLVASSPSTLPLVPVSSHTN